MKYSLIAILLLIGLSLKAQDTTLLYYSTGNHRECQGSNKMKMKDLFKTIKPHAESYAYIESARDYKLFTNILYNIGAVPVGLAIGYYLPTNEMK